MWPSCGGRFYWAPARPSPAEARGVVVVFAWVWSDEAQLRPFVELYSSLGWLCLVCRADVVLLYLSEKAASLASGVISELVKELKVKPLPTVLASFSGGSKGCMYKVIQLLDGKCGDETMVTPVTTPFLGTRPLHVPQQPMSSVADRSIMPSHEHLKRINLIKIRRNGQL